MKCKPNCAPGGTLSKTRLASCSGGILAGSTGEYWRAAPARYWPDTRQDPPARDTLAIYAGILSGILGGIHWLAGSTRRDTRRGSGTRRDPLAAGSTGELLWRDTRRDPLAELPGSGPLDTRRDPLASRSGGILGGIHWRAAPGGILGGILARDPLANCRSGGILGGIHWRDPLAGPLASGGILGGIHWRPLWRDTGRDPLAGYWAGSTGKSNNPFLSGGGKKKKKNS